MFAQAISSMSAGASKNPPRTEPTPSSGTFGEILNQQVGGKGKVDSVDEEKALKELFHILAMLSLGQVDGSVFSESEAAPGTPAGPARTEVETLKKVIRQFMRGGQGGDSTTDRGSQGTSLNALFQSLPTEIQDLLRRAFPSADQLLADEAKKLLKSS